MVIARSYITETGSRSIPEYGNRFGHGGKLDDAVETAYYLSEEVDGSDIGRLAVFQRGCFRKKVRDVGIRSCIRDAIQ